VAVLRLEGSSQGASRDRSLILIVTKFELTGHRRARHCYAWSAQADDGREKIVTMLDPLG